MCPKYSVEYDELYRKIKVSWVHVQFDAKTEGDIIEYIKPHNTHFRKTYIAPEPSVWMALICLLIQYVEQLER